MESELNNLSPFEEGATNLYKTPDIGIGETEMKQLLDFFEGKGESPKWLEAFLSDAPERVKTFTHVAIALQLARIPSLITMLNSVNQRLYGAENLAEMDISALSTASKNLSAEIANIQESSRRSLESIEKSGGVNSKYRSLLDTLINSSPAEIESMQEYLQLKSEGKDPLAEAGKKTETDTAE